MWLVKAKVFSKALQETSSSSSCRPSLVPSSLPFSSCFQLCGVAVSRRLPFVSPRRLSPYCSRRPRSTISVVRRVVPNSPSSPLSSTSTSTPVRCATSTSTPVRCAVLFRRVLISSVFFFPFFASSSLYVLLCLLHHMAAAPVTGSSSQRCVSTFLFWCLFFPFVSFLHSFSMTFSVLHYHHTFSLSTRSVKFSLRYRLFIRFFPSGIVSSSCLRGLSPIDVVCLRSPFSILRRCSSTSVSAFSCLRCLSSSVCRSVFCRCICLPSVSSGPCRCKSIVH